MNADKLQQFFEKTKAACWVSSICFPADSFAG